jgi:hypothetical protein
MFLNPHPVPFFASMTAMAPPFPQGIARCGQIAPIWNTGGTDCRTKNNSFSSG